MPKQKLIYPEQINVAQSIQQTAKLLADRWSLLILRHLMWNSEEKKPETGPRRFSELKRLLPGISPKTLSKKLKEMETLGILQKIIYAEVPVKVEYRITEKGKGLKEVLKAITEWNIRNI